YQLWRQKVIRERVSDTSTLEEAIGLCAISQIGAVPVNRTDTASPWITGPELALQALESVLGKSDYVARAGVCTWLNGVFWLELITTRPDNLVVVSNVTEGGKLQVDSVQIAVEPDLLYPLLRSGSVSRWHAEPRGLILITHEPGMRMKAMPE